MKSKEVSIFSELDNNGVVKLPDCDYLGCVIPADVLFLMHGDAMDIIEELKYNPGSDVFYKAFSLAKGIEDRLQHYIDVCKEHDLEPGFSLDLSVRDYQELLI